MKKRIGKGLKSIVMAAVMAASLFPGCAANNASGEEEPITVYLWSSALYSEYAPYIQSQLPDVDIQFVVGNNDLDFYKFMNENGELPDIITTRRFSLHDAADLKEKLMNLSTTEEAGAIYEAYLKSFTNSDGTVNWLPLCGEVDGLVANRNLFEKYDIPLPTDYESFAYSCRAFEEVGVRGFVADFVYDYTCMEVLQGLSIPEINSMEGQLWRLKYEDPSVDDDGLDEKIWRDAFEKMERFISDAFIQPGDLELSYSPVIKMFTNEQAAIIRTGGAETVALKAQGDTDPVFLPYFGQDGEQWLLTYPSFQVALNKDLEKDNTRKEQALQVLRVMLSDEGQNTLAKGNDVISYSQNVELELSPALDELTPLIKQNHLYIRIASNDFFSASLDVVQKMIKGEYNAAQAFEEFNAQLKQPKDEPQDIVLSLEQGYSNIFRKNGGNKSNSAMAHSLREYYGSDVLVAPAYSFTGSVIKADYTEEMVESMVMPNSLEAWNCEMTGAELTEYLKTAVEGMENGFTPFNRGSLPTVSGITIEVQENEGKYTMKRVLMDGKEINAEDSFKVTCLNTAAYMAPFLKDESRVFENEEPRVRLAWAEYIVNGGSIAKPENYITLV